MSAYTQKQRYKIMHKLVILDAFRTNPGDLSWEPVERLADVVMFDRTAPGDVVKNIGDADMVLTNKTVITAEDIAKVPNVKYIGVMATGTNVVDVKAAVARGITVTNIPSYSTMSVAQTAIAHLLNIVTRVEHYTDEIRKGEWSVKPDFCYWNHRLFELADKRIGIVGFGHIGSAVAGIAQALGMKPVIFTSKSADELPEGMEKAKDLDSLFAECDVVSLHCPLAPDTYHLVDERRLNLMKPEAILINTSRGPLIDETALANALKSGKIHAAGLDVMEKEPPASDNPLLSVDNCFITPHIGWATLEARIRLINITADNIKAYLDGHPINTVS